jgi:hypothetical protein
LIRADPASRPPPPCRSVPTPCRDLHLRVDPRRPRVETSSSASICTDPVSRPSSPRQSSACVIFRRLRRHLLLYVETASTGQPLLLLYKPAQLLVYRLSNPTAPADPLRLPSCSHTGQPSPSEARSWPSSGISTQIWLGNDVSMTPSWQPRYPPTPTPSPSRPPPLASLCPTWPQPTPPSRLRPPPPVSALAPSRPFIAGAGCHGSHGRHHLETRHCSDRPRCCPRSPSGVCRRR